MKKSFFKYLFIFSFLLCIPFFVFAQPAYPTEGGDADSGILPPKDESSMDGPSELDGVDLGATPPPEKEPFPTGSGYTPNNGTATQPPTAPGSKNETFPTGSGSTYGTGALLSVPPKFQPSVPTPESDTILNSIVPTNLFGGEPLNKLLNQLFYIGLVAAVILAIVMIVRGGVEYMTIDAIASKENGKNRVKAALGGLLLSFSAILILNTINPGLTNLRIVFPKLITISSVQVQGSFKSLAEQTVMVTPGSEGSAQFQNINNANQKNASAEGVLTINGNAYAFKSGGGGNGYIPPGTYTVTMNTNEYSDGTRTTSGFVKDGVGFAFNLNDAHDPRTGLYREDLRIHPDGNNPGTIGCIGLQGNSTELLQFKSDLTKLIKENGGKYTITVGK